MKSDSARHKPLRPGTGDGPTRAEALLSRRAGLSLLAGIVVCLAIWLTYQRAQIVMDSDGAIDSAGAVALPPIGASPSSAHFRAEAFYLPDDPLLGFVEIPGGPFTMGSDPRVDRMAFENERWSPEQLQGRVDLPGFYMGRYEVTVAQFRTFVEATGHGADPRALDGPPDHPASFVSWVDALAYARWLERALTASPETPPALARLLRAGWHLSLPDEAQWEKAARGTDGRIFPWGDAPDTACTNFASSAALPVGSFQAQCALPLDDMSGNVWELTRSAWQPYPFDPDDDWQDLDGDALVVMRGGSFQDAANTIRTAVRGGADPGARRAFIGFRLALLTDAPGSDDSESESFGRRNPQ